MALQLPLPLSGETIKFPLTQDKVATVDAIDSDLTAFKWHAYHSGNTYYVRRNPSRETRQTIHIHRIILERVLGRKLAPSEKVDHINGNGCDNRRCNLRVATHAENMRNQRRGKANSSGYKGVTFHKASGKWRGQIKVNGKLKMLGHFNTPEEAHEAYKQAAKELFGDFARFE